MLIGFIGFIGFRAAQKLFGGPPSTTEMCWGAAKLCEATWHVC